MQLGEIVDALDRACPEELAAEWDNVGLHLGARSQDISVLSVALDADLPTIRRAIEAGSQLLVAHHPLLREGHRRLVDEDPDALRVLTAIRRNLAVFCMHTNFDSAEGGVSDVLAERLGLTGTQVLAPAGSPRKIVVFVPEEHVEQVFLAMSTAGAGRIGAYKECSFRLLGQGTFSAPADAHPALGKAGRANVVDEIRLEMTVEEHSVPAVVSAVKDAHPYEEVAYDVYALASGGTRRAGFGRLGSIEPVRLDDFAGRCADQLGVSTVKFCGDAEREVRAVAVCGGSGGSLVDAAVGRGADVLVSGDIRYHDAQRAVAMGLCVVDAGHDGTEAPAVAALSSLVEESIRGVGYTGRVIVDEQPGLWRPAGG